jgi:hypothetical protein
MELLVECSKILRGIIRIATLWIFIGLIAGCSKSNNVLLGRIESRIGTHTVIVTDCYRTSVPSPQTIVDSTDGSIIVHFKPCMDAEIIIHNEQLFVNGISYEKLTPGDTVVLDHGRVLINTHDAQKSSAPTRPPSSR